MAETIKAQIQADMKTAMRSQDKDRLSVIRLILAALKQREVDERIFLSDEQILGILNKMIKQRRDAIQQFEAGQRPDLVAKEQAEIVVIEHYLPAQLDEAAIEAAVKKVIADTQATGPKDMGKVMGALKLMLQGKADMTVVSAKVKVLLNEG